jgi:hypothetical protein
MTCLFTGVGVGHSSIRSRIKGLLKGVRAVFVKEKARETGDTDEEEDTEPPGKFPMEGVEVEDDVPVDDEDIDEDGEGWETDHGGLSDSEDGMDEDGD